MAAEALAEAPVQGLDPALLEAELAERCGESRPASAIADVVDRGLALLEEGRVRLDPDMAADVADALHEAAAKRTVLLRGGEHSLGSILAAFAEHCEAELDDVETGERFVASASAELWRFDTRWRTETTRVEVRHGLVGLAATRGALRLLLAPLDTISDSAFHDMAADAELRDEIAVYDLDRLERMSAARSSVFVYFEWFLQAEYGAKLAQSEPFTAALVDLGLINLGFG